MGLRNHFEETVWAAAFAKCYTPGLSKRILRHAIECADLTILQLRKFEIENKQFRGTPHVLDMTKHITAEGELDLDSE